MTAPSVYRELGERIEQTFERDGRKLSRFARIAADALHEARIPGRSSADEVLAWVLGAGEIPPQNDMAEAFGEPPITLYRGRDFHIEVLFWWSTVTTVHGHGFSGAFQPLSGERLQTRHAFEPRRPLPESAKTSEKEAPAMFGTLKLAGAEVLVPGDVVEITHDLVHAVVHLAEPSATIVVRTPSDPDAGPQLDYRAPWVALDPFDATELRVRKLQVLRLLCRTAAPEALVRAAELVRGSDLATCLGVLDLVYTTYRTEVHIAPVLDAARERHGEGAVSLLAMVLREDRRLRAVHALRRGTSDPDQRFLLALLQHLPAQADILPLLSARFPGEDPRARAEAIAAGLSGVDRIGVDFDDPFTRALVRAMLREESPAGIRRELSKSFDPADVRAREGAIDQHAARLRRTVLAPLFRVGGEAAVRARGPKGAGR